MKYTENICMLMIVHLFPSDKSICHWDFLCLFGF
ncbi:TPA: tetracycline resistance determinant leader peptide [Streptococcus pyogenes]|nr:MULTISPECIES: tetracycline resistance determinant leader peptide [Bacillota]MDU3930826.1 tetracycline resistance determinant leader peptide [Veillonella sp.]